MPWTLTSDANLSSNPVSTTANRAPSLLPASDSVPLEDSSLSKSSSGPGSNISSNTDSNAENHARILSLHHFNKALKEITPSSSEALGSLADLRKWNEEFGEGRKDKKRRQVWGKDRFGFTDQREKIREEGRVASIGAPSSEAHTTGTGK